MSIDNKPEIVSLSDFLCGATGPESWLKQHFDDYLQDISITWDEDDVRELGEGYFIGFNDDSVLLLKREGEKVDLAGYYLPPGAVCLKECHQGKGLGKELILATYEWCGGPPTEGLDEQCFTKSGYWAHVSAYRLGVQRGIFIDKKEQSPTYEPGY